MSENTFNVPEELQDFYKNHKQVVDVVRTLKVIAKLDSDPGMNQTIAAHPEAVVSIALSIVDNLGSVFSELQKFEQPESFSRENIALAFLVGMTARSIQQEAELTDSISELTEAMFTATNFAAETMH